MRKVKKIVSLVLAVTLVLSIVGTFTDALPASAADGDGAADWVTTSEALTMTGDAEKGYNLSTTAQGQAALLKRPVDFKKESVQFRFQPEAGDWAYLYLKPASSAQTVSAFAGGLLDANGQMTIMMERVTQFSG